MNQHPDSIPTYIIAEIGINYVVSLDTTTDYRKQNLETAKKLIDVAKVAGCNAVKFQKRNPDVCVPEDQKSVIRSTPWGDMTYLDYKHRVEFGKDEYDEIDRYCKERGIEWSASVWDFGSLEFLLQYDVPWIKIPSALATDLNLLENCLDTGKQVIVSTGMCSDNEVHDIVDVVNKYPPVNGKRHVVMHTNSTYPAAIDDLQLSFIKRLRYMSEMVPSFYSDTTIRYQFDVGYSGHEFGLITSIASIYLGATYIERHITLDRAMWGTDQLSSVGPKGLIEFVDGIRELERAYGRGFNNPNIAYLPRVLTDGEIAIRKKLRPSN